MVQKLTLPNVRKLFIPDPGYTIFEADLKGADAQVVAWEADDEDLKTAFRAGLDIHVHNAEAMWGTKFTSLPIGSYARDSLRQDCKHTVHGIHYGCTPRTTAIQRGWTVAEAERFHNRWYSIHPGVKRYQDRVRSWLERDRTVWNKFGFRRQFFDRIDECYTEALAWIPQGTVALTSYIGMMQLEEMYQDCEMLLQVHDSCVFQFPNRPNMPTPKQIKEGLANPIPYDDPLTIPWDLKSSTKSWGECEKTAA